MQIIVGGGAKTVGETKWTEYCHKHNSDTKENSWCDDYHCILTKGENDTEQCGRCRHYAKSGLMIMDFEPLIVEEFLVGEPEFDKEYPIKQEDAFTSDGIFNTLKQSANSIPDNRSEEDKKAFKDLFTILANNTNFRDTSEPRYILIDTSKKNIARLEKLFDCKIRVVKKGNLLCQIIWTDNEKG